MEFSLTYILSQVFTILMYTTLVVTYYMKDRKKVLMMNFLGLVLIGIAYMLLSAYTGLAMTVIGIVRNIIFLIDEKENGKSEKIVKKDVFILLFIYLLTVIATTFTYTGFLSLLSVFATSLYTFSVWQKKTIIYRVLGIPIGILWVSYNIYVASLFGVICESILLFAALGGFILAKRRKED